MSEITTFLFLPLGLPQQFTVAYKEPYYTLTDIRPPGLNQTTQILLRTMLLSQKLPWMGFII